MDRETIEKEVRQHFETWSGGFPPETEHEIRVYLDYACSVEAPEEVLLDILYEWAQEEDEEEERPVAPFVSRPRVERLRSRTHFGSTLWFVDDDRGGRSSFRSVYGGELGHG